MKTDIRRVTVAGAGTMGVVLTRVFAAHGYAVTLWNRRENSLGRAKESIRRDVEAMAQRGTLAEAPEHLLDRIRYTTDLDTFREADFVLENIAEDLEVKREFYQKISPLVGPDALLATNTSGLRVSDIAQAVTDPGRFCGMHWWNPPDLMPLVEITKGDGTRDETAQAILALAESLGKKPVIVQKDILGIIGNRLQYAVLREAMHILATGAAGAEEIDAAMKYGPGFRYSILGPFETGDLGGLDILRSVSDYLFPDLGTEQHSQILRDLAEAGRLGVKSGGGFYDYADGAGDEIIRWRNELLEKQWELIAKKENPV